MIAAEHPKMAQLQLRQLDLPKTVSDSFERTCFESLPRNLAASLAEQSFPSLTLPSLSLPQLDLAQLDLRELDLSLSLIDENRFQRIIFKEGIFGDRSLEETAKHIEHKLAEGEAGTNSFSNLSFQEELSREHKKQIAAREAGTNSFSKSFLDRILSLRKWLQIFLLSSIQLTCAALLLGTYSVSMSFQSLSEQLCRNSFQTLSNQLCRSTLDSLIRQLDLVTSLSLALWLGSRSCRTQLQNKQVQQMTQKSFQLTQVQLCQNVAQRGVQHKAFSKIALRTRSSRRSLTTRSWRTRSSPTASTTTSTQSTTRSLRRTLLSIVWFSFLISNIFISSSFWKQEVAENDELSENVWEQELGEQLAAKPFHHDQLQQNLSKREQEQQA